MRRFAAKPLVRDSFVSLCGNAIGRITSLAVPVVIAARYGANIDTDAFYLVLAAALFAYNLLQGTLELSFVPVYSELRSKNNPETKRLVGSVILALVLGGAAIFAVIDVLIWSFAPMVLIHERQAFVRLIVWLTWEMSPLVIVFALVALFAALFNAERWFFAAGVVPALQSLGVVIFIFLLKARWDIHAASAGIFFGALAQVVFMVLWFKKKRSRIELALDYPYILKVLQAAAPLALTLSIFLIIPFVDRIIVTLFLQEGNVTALENATRLSQIPWSLGTVGYITVFLSWWSRKSSEGDVHYVRSTFKRLFAWSCAVFIPASILLFWGAFPLVELIFGHGKYPSGTLTATSEVFAYLALGYWAFMLRSTLIRFYSAQQNPSVITKAAIWDFCAHLLVSLLLVQTVGVATIGIATSVGYLVSLGYLMAYYLVNSRSP